MAVPWGNTTLLMQNLTRICQPGTGGTDQEDLNDVVAAIRSIVKIVVPIFFGLIFVLGLMGNTCVVTVVAANPGMRSTTNILIINLAVADLLFVIFCIPFTATDYVLTSWPFGNLWCKIVQYLIIVTACASVYILVLMSLDRFLAVVHPIRSMSVRTVKHASVATCIMWIVILICSIPVLLVHGEVLYQEINDDPCALMQTTTEPPTEQIYAGCRILEEVDWPLFQISFFLLSFVIPLTLICGLYMAMLNRLWKGSRVSAESRRGRKRVTRLVIVVVGVFAICWCPIQMILVLKSLKVYPLSKTSIMIQVASHVLAYMNSCVNPILYAFLSDNFRKAFRKIIYCRSRQDQFYRNGPATKTTRTGSSGGIL